MTDTPAIWQFAGAYLHQDWPEEYGDPWRALAAFVVDEPALAATMPDEIDRLLTTHPTEAALESYMDALGCEYRAGQDEGGYRGWLTEVARRVRAATST